MDLNKMKRRKLLNIGLAGLVSAGLALGAGRYLERRFTYVPPQEIAALLDPHIEAKVHDAEGNRTLFVVGDTHLGFGKTYDDLFRNLEKRVSVDKLFMEGVYDHDAEPDPHIACMKDAAEIERIRFLPAEWKKEDSQGYFRLSERYDTRGIEDKELRNDSGILGRIYTGILSWSITKDPFTEEKIRELYDKLSVKNFKLDSLKSMTKPELESLKLKVKEEGWKTSVCRRNSHLVDVIDREVRPYEVGALILGEAHCDASFQDVPEGKSADIIIPYLQEKGINVIYIDVGQAVEYNKRMEK